jgi:NADH-quinone oxidoreductase subunit J
MQPVATTFFFYMLSGIAVLGGILVITRRNAVHSALALILTLLSVAGLYLMLYAPFVAGVQIILYAGGIMVLFLFVIMLVNLEKSQKEEQFNKIWLIGLLGALGLGALFVGVFLKSARSSNDIFSQLLRRPLVAFADESNTQAVGQMLYQNYLFAFEIASLLLLVAIIGAVVMAKKRIN